MLQHCCQSFQSDITLKFDPTFFLTFTFKLIREHDFYLHLKRLSEIKFNDSSRSFTIAEYENLKFQNILNFLFSILRNWLIVLLRSSFYVLTLFVTVLQSTYYFSFGLLHLRSIPRRKSSIT